MTAVQCAINYSAGNKSNNYKALNKFSMAINADSSKHIHNNMNFKKKIKNKKQTPVWSVCP